MNFGEVAPACRGHDPELWFATRFDVVETAVAICRSCPLMQACAEHGVRLGAEGVWGGKHLVAVAGAGDPQGFLSGLAPGSRRRWQQADTVF